ncbi:thiocillin family RiPP [Bacillus atrophaeus]|uniref:thiocillin family RiPP n=1 Tax=Bacillus atrophaeus TaxID=1452 RepID=UPI0030F39153
MEKEKMHELELFAEELPEQVDLATIAASFSSTSSVSTASCPGTTAASAGTVSCYG